MPHLPVLIAEYPHTPRDLAAFQNGRRRLTLYWNVKTTETITYSLKATNLDDPTADVITIDEISDRTQQVVSISESITTCDRYRIELTAVDRRISTTTEILAYFPMEPDMTQIVDSIRHTLSLTRQGIELRVTFDVSSHHYLFLLMSVCTISEYRMWWLYSFKILSSY